MKDNFYALEDVLNKDEMGDEKTNVTLDVVKATNFTENTKIFEIPTGIALAKCLPNFEHFFVNFCMASVSTNG